VSESSTNDALERWQRVLATEFVLEREIERRGARIAFAARSRRGGHELVVHVIDTGSIGARGTSAGGASLARDASSVLASLARAARLRHERILPIEATGACDGLPWFASPRVEGVTLATWLERERELPFLESARVLSELAEALAHAHAAGVVHGALTTHDVLWSDTHVKLCHLGAAPCSRGASETIALDIRAFGEIAYELLAGRKPHASSGARITPVNELRHHIPPGLAYVVMRCLTGDRVRAWRSMDDIVPLLAHLVTPPRGYEAPHLVNQGRFLCRRPGPLLRESLERFESAAKIDPRSARAFAGIGEASCLLAIHAFERPESALRRAIDAARQAVAIDAACAEAHIALGLAELVRADGIVAARASFETAVDVAMSDDGLRARALSLLSLALLRTERIDDAIEHARRAIESDPQSARSHAVLSRALAAGDRIDEALAAMHRAIELDPSWEHERQLGLLLARANDAAAATDRLRRAVETSQRHPWTISALARTLASSDERVEAESLYRELVQRAQPDAGLPFAQPTVVASVALALGLAHDATDWLARANGEGDAAKWFAG